MAQLFHGADSSKILHIINTGQIPPDSQNDIYFDETSIRNCFVHGADIGKKASFVLKVEVDLTKFHHYRTSKPGNPTTLIVSSPTPVPIRILELYVRTGSRDDGFEIDKVTGLDQIKLRVQ